MKMEIRKSKLGLNFNIQISSFQFPLYQFPVSNFYFLVSAFQSLNHKIT